MSCTVVSDAVHSKSVHLPELDGVRGAAILSVIVWHYGVDPVLRHGPHPLWTRTLLVPLSYTWSGVDLFFVLSGFLLGGILLDHRQSENYYPVFYVRRFFRIIPLYTVWLALFWTLPVIAPEFANRFSILFADPFPWHVYATYTQNFAMAGSGTWGSGWLGITWSLAVEEHFYLFLPLLIRRVPPRRLAIMLVILMLSGPVTRWFAPLVVDHPHLARFVLTPCRIDSPLLGVLCAWIIRQPAYRTALAARPRWLIHAALLSASACLFLDGVIGGGRVMETFAPIATAYAALLLFVISRPASKLAAAMRWRPLRGLGVLAYGVYLMHDAVNYILHGLLRGSEPSVSSLSAGCVTVLAFALTLTLAYVSWRWFERPLVRIGQAIPYRESVTRTAEIPA